MKKLTFFCFALFLGCSVDKKSVNTEVSRSSAVICNIDEAVKLAEKDFYTHSHKYKYKLITENDSEWSNYFRPDTAQFIILLDPICFCSGGDVTYYIAKKSCKVTEVKLGQ